MSSGGVSRPPSGSRRVLFGILATIVAARELSNTDFARFALVFAITGLLQLFLDLTIDEVVVKYGNRYAARGDWGRFQRLFGLGLRVKLLGGVVGSLAIVLAALLSPWIWGLHGIEGPLLVASLIPIVQAPEGMASAALLIRNRYDVRAACLLWSMALRLVAIVIGASIGVTATFVAIVLAQVVATLTVSAVGLYAHRRWPRVEAEPLGDHAKEIRSFAIQSTAASGLQSLRGVLPLVLVGVVATTSQVAYFRIAQAPQTAFASLSSPARMVMLAEQTRDIEHGRHDRAWRLLRRYIGSAAGIVLVVVPLAWIWMESLIRIIYGARYIGATDAARLMLLAAAVQLILGWTKSFPSRSGSRACARRDKRSRSAPSCRSSSSSGASTARPEQRAASSARRLGAGRLLARRSPADARAPARRRGRRRLVECLIVSGIWPPDVGGPASHAPELASWLRAHGHQVEVVTTADAPPAPQPYAVRWASRRLPRGIRHLRALALIATRARHADVVYATSMIVRSSTATALARVPLVVKAS